MNRVTGKIAIVTGAASGIGRASAELLAREGATVVMTDIDREQGAQVLDELGGAELSVDFLAQDAASEDDWRQVMEHTVSRYGRLDVLVNNAGIAIVNNVEDTSLEEWRRTQAVNLDGVFLGTRHAIERMKPNGGSIINISSIEGMVGEPLAAAYNASKGGVRIFTKSAALHCARSGYNIRVNSVHPGFTMTNMIAGALATMTPKAAADFQTRTVDKIPMGRIGEPLDIAQGVLYLASDEAKYVTGSELVIDGGYLAQ